MSHTVTEIFYFFNKVPIIDLIKDMDYKYKIGTISKDDLFNADEIFYCGSASEVTPIREIDNYNIGNGKAGDLTLKLQKFY